MSQIIWAILNPLLKPKPKMTTELIIQDVSGILGDPKSPFAAKKEQLIITASHCLEQGLPNLYCKGPSSKYFLLCWPYGLCYNYSTPSFYQEKSSYVPIELYLQTQVVKRRKKRQVASRIWPMGLHALHEYLISSLKDEKMITYFFPSLPFSFSSWDYHLIFSSPGGSFCNITKYKKLQRHYQETRETSQQLRESIWKRHI